MGHAMAPRMRTILGRKFYSREPLKVLTRAKIWISIAIFSTVNGSGPYFLYPTLSHSEISTKPRQKRYICFSKSFSCFRYYIECSDIFSFFTKKRSKQIRVRTQTAEKPLLAIPRKTTEKAQGRASAIPWGCQYREGRSLGT